MNRNQPPSITIKKIHIRYKHHWLFDKLDLYLPAKKWSCLLGPSGVGKTTLLKFMCSLKYEKDTERCRCRC